MSGERVLLLVLVLDMAGTAGTAVSTGTAGGWRPVYPLPPRLMTGGYIACAASPPRGSPVPAHRDTLAVGLGRTAPAWVAVGPEYRLQPEANKGLQARMPFFLEKKGS